MYPLGYQPTLPTGTTFTRRSLREGYPWVALSRVPGLNYDKLG